MVSNYAFAAALVAALPLASATIGNAVIENNCAFPVYMWSVSNVAGPEIIIPAGANHTEQYYTNPNGGGISIKMASNSAAATVTQFEYTLDTTSLWYDVSNINGYPFEQWGLTLVPSDATCPSVTCDAGVAECEDVYNQSDDNAATHWCGSASNMVMVLCSGNVAAASSIASSAVSVVSTAKTSTTQTATTTTKAPLITTASTSTSKTTTTPKAAITTTTTSQPLPTTTTTAAVEVSLTTITTTLVTVTQSGSASTITSSLDSSVDATSTTATSATTTDDRVFHGHTFAWPSFTGFPGSKARRHHQHMHAHGHRA